MILPLRHRHRVMVTTLAVVLPIAFVAGIAARKPAPTMVKVPALSGDGGSNLTTAIWLKEDMWPQQKFRTRLVSNPSGRLAVELVASRDFIRPDLLVYWTSNNAPTGKRLPDDAALLGAYAPERQLLLPEHAKGKSGTLVLYSLADHEVVAISKSIAL